MWNQITIPICEIRKKIIEDISKFQLFPNYNVNFISYFWEEKDKLFMITESCSPMILYIQKFGLIKKIVIKNWIIMILNSLKSLYDNGYTYHYLSLERLYYNPHSGQVKIGDLIMCSKSFCEYVKENDLCFFNSSFPSPEIINNSNYSIKADIFALGMIVLEMITIEPPYLSDGSKYINYYTNPIFFNEKSQMIKSHKLPSTINLIPNDEPLKNLILDMIDFNYETRPTIESLLERKELKIDMSIDNGVITPLKKSLIKINKHEVELPKESFYNKMFELENKSIIKSDLVKKSFKESKYDDLNSNTNKSSNDNTYNRKITKSYKQKCINLISSSKDISNVNKKGFIEKLNKSDTNLTQLISGKKEEKFKGILKNTVVHNSKNKNLMFLLGNSNKKFVNSQYNNNNLNIQNTNSQNIFEGLLMPNIDNNKFHYTSDSLNNNIINSSFNINNESSLLIHEDDYNTNLSNNLTSWIKDDVHILNNTTNMVNSQVNYNLYPISLYKGNIQIPNYSSKNCIAKANKSVLNNQNNSNILNSVFKRKMSNSSNNLPRNFLENTTQKLSINTKDIIRKFSKLNANNNIKKFSKSSCNLERINDKVNKVNISINIPYTKKDIKFNYNLSNDRVCSVMKEINKNFSLLDKERSKLHMDILKLVDKSEKEKYLIKASNIVLEMDHKYNKNSENRETIEESELKRSDEYKYIFRLYSTLENFYSSKMEYDIYYNTS